MRAKALRALSIISTVLSLALLLAPGLNGVALTSLAAGMRGAAALADLAALTLQIAEITDHMAIASRRLTSNILDVGADVQRLAELGSLLRARADLPETLVIEIVHAMALGKIGARLPAVEVSLLTHRLCDDLRALLSADEEAPT
ncbi:hypothetical protein ACWDLG_44655 [Nonomuraea sp. NPDC003727]